MKTLSAYVAIAFMCLSVLSAPARAAHTNEPEIDPFRFEHFFQGPIHARGFVRNRGGEVIRRFWAEIVGTWDERTGELTLDEILHFDDGEVLERVWQIERLANGEYRGRAGDVEGVATGEVSGPDGVLRYALTVQYRGMDLVLSVVDRFHAVSEDVMYNNTQLKKFGFNVGSVSSVFYKGAAIPPEVQLPNTTAAVSD
ncbi:MAG: DUF3833 family protein [Pseudomonadota bacterium]